MSRKSFAAENFNTQRLEKEVALEIVFRCHGVGKCMSCKSFAAENFKTRHLEKEQRR
jgi:hypothetical protein